MNDSGVCVSFKFECVGAMTFPSRSCVYVSVSNIIFTVKGCLPCGGFFIINFCDLNFEKMRPCQLTTG